MSVRDWPFAVGGFSLAPPDALPVAPLGTVATVLAGASLVAAFEFEGTSGVAVAVAGSVDFSCLPAFDLSEVAAGLSFSLDFAPFSSTALPLSLPTGAMLLDCVRAVACKAKARTITKSIKTFFIKHSNSYSCEMMRSLCSGRAMAGHLLRIV